MGCEHFNVLLVADMRHCVCCSLKVHKSALFCLGYPCIIVAVAVEDDTLVILDSLADKVMERLVEVLCLFKLVSKLHQHLSNSSIEVDVSTGDAVG